MQLQETDCLLIVDVQNDFCPGGALAVPGGDQVVAPINELSPQFPLVIASRDAHPLKSRHFDSWPVHCVEGTVGADFHPALDTTAIAQVFLKGTSPDDDGYSAFAAGNLDLQVFLAGHQVKRLFVCGLATDYCVKVTAADAVARGFSTFVVEDAIKAVNARAGDGEAALMELRGKGVRVLRSSAITGVSKEQPPTP